MAIDRKACFQRQLLDISNETDDLDERVTALEQGSITVDAYTKAESDAKFQTIAGMSTYATKSELFSGDYNDLTNKPNLSIYAEKTETVTKDENGNVNGVLQVAQLESESWDEDDDCKADIYISSGLRRSTITLETEGEETGSSLILQGTTSVGSEGIIDLHGETRVFTNSRITVIDDNDDTEQVAYLSDITSASVSTYNLALGTSSNNFWFATITAEPGLEDIYTGSDAISFINDYARYVSWYYENSNDSTDNHKMCTFTVPGQQLNFYLADGTIKITTIPPTQAVLTVTKTN